MKYKIMVLDLDGTLTNSQKKISSKTKKSLINLQKKGVKLVLASGRPTQGITPLAQELSLEKYNGYILSYNGAKIINYQTGEVIYNATLPKELVPQVYNEAVKNDVGILTYDGDKIVLGNGVDRYVELESKINGIPMEEVDDFVEYVDFDVNKCLLTGDGDRMALLEKDMKGKFGDKLNIYRSEPFFLEVMPQNIDKAYSLSKLLEPLGIDREEMVCCGDGFNDLSMIKYAGLGVAMENAQPKVKEAADFVTLSNDEDGVAYVVDKFFS